MNGINVGDRVRIVADGFGQARRGLSLIGRTGTVRRYSAAHGNLSWDVELDTPLPDRRRLLWFSTHELSVIVPAVLAREAVGVA